MGRIAFGRATFFAALVGLMAVQAVAGCGSTGTPGTAEGGNGAASGSSDGGRDGEGGSPSDAGTGDVGNAGETGGTSAGGNAPSGGGSSGGGGRTNPTGGKGNVGGTTGVGNAAGVGNAGSFSRGGSGGVGGGVVTGGVGGSAPACIDGVPCNCKKLVGTIECNGSEGTCVCPPAAECAAPAESPCFEPCGGEPFGAWVLEEGCFGATSSTNNIPVGCETVLQGTPGDGDLRLRILDGGGLDVFGTEAWSLSARVSLACLGVTTVNSCSGATFWSNSLLFASTRPSSCEANACGVCDCVDEVESQAFNGDSWSRSGTELQLGFSAPVSYCVTGDELWLGGPDADGNPKVSYKFKKQSCTGTPLPCAARTSEQCGQGGNCSIGVCKATTGTLPRCATAFSATECGVLQGCSWDPEGCAGEAPASCEFWNCTDEPGCTWGPPRERCGGEAWSCDSSDANACTAPGCSVRACQPDFSEYGECHQLQNATACGKAVGCSWTAGACVGDALCAAQTDAATCTSLNCFSAPYCGGTPPECSSLTVATCHSTPGCILEW